MVHEALYDPLVRTIASLGLIPLVVLAATLGLVALIYVLTSDRPDIASREAFKRLRYEAGNPMKGEARGKVSMQYLGYLIVFLAVEPAVILLALALAAPKALYGRLLALYLFLILVYAPLLYYGLRMAGRTEEWVLD